MGILDNFLSLFHRRHRFTPEYTNLAFLKKTLFLGTVGSIFVIAASKFVYASLSFYFEPNEVNRMYIKLNPALDRGVYQPSLPFVMGIFQRLYARFIEEEPFVSMSENDVDGSRVYEVTLHDRVASFSKKKQQNMPLVLVVAGSEGIDNTVRSLLLASYNLGYRVVAVDPADLHDQARLSLVVEELKKKYRCGEVLGVGVEYGANLLVNLAARKQEIFSGLVSIGNPFDLTRSELRLQQSWLWRQLYNSMLKCRIARIPTQISSSIPSPTLFQLDKYIYNVDDSAYLQWKKSHSSINSIANLKVPTLFIQSMQDPFTVKPEGDERFQNQKCIYVSTQRGGHNQWFENLWMNRWIMAPVRSFLKLVHDKKVEQIVKPKSDSQ